jgi:hypothetical protein
VVGEHVGARVRDPRFVLGQIESAVVVVAVPIPVRDLGSHGGDIGDAKLRAEVGQELPRVQLHGRPAIGQRIVEVQQHRACFAPRFHGPFHTMSQGNLEGATANRESAVWRIAAEHASFAM